MQLTKLFEEQIPLREKIIKKHKLETTDLMPNFILSFQVELSELANEWQGFKHWKENPEPKPGMLEEYADGLSFLLEIGLELAEEWLVDEDYEIHIFGSIKNKFFTIYRIASYFFDDYNEETYKDLVGHYLGLGIMLGFTIDQIEQAYFSKNKVNHERQASGY